MLQNTNLVVAPDGAKTMSDCNDLKNKKQSTSKAQNLKSRPVAFRVDVKTDAVLYLNTHWILLISIDSWCF